MKIKVIGTGDIWSKYNSPSFLIDDNIIIDMPNGNCKELVKNKIMPNNIKYVLITHFHADHYFDVPFYLLSKVKNEIKDETNIYLSKDGIMKIKKLFLLGFPNSVLKVHNKTKINYITNDNFNIDKYNISKIKVEHGNMKPAYGYIFNKGKKSVGFTGDSSYCPNIDYMASNCNYLFIDSTKLVGNEKHMGTDNIKFLAEKYPKCVFYPIHMGDNARKMLSKTKIKNIIVLKDGEDIEIKM